MFQLEQERIVLVTGAAEFRLLDERLDSATYRHWNRFATGEPGTCVRVPAGVAHTIRARGAPVVLQVLAISLVTSLAGSWASFFHHQRHPRPAAPSAENGPRPSGASPQP